MVPSEGLQGRVHVTSIACCVEGGEGPKVTVEDIKGGFERVQRARDHLAAADFGPVLHGASAFASPELDENQRRAMLAEASGDPLTDSVLELLTALTELTPEGGLATLAEQADGELRPGGELRPELREAWFAPFLEFRFPLYGRVA